MENFELGGHRLTIDDRREAYNMLRLKYQTLAVSARTEFLSAYPSFTSMDDIHQRFVGLARAKLAPVVDIAIRDLVDAGIYDVNDTAFLDRYVSRYHEWERKFEAVEQPYLQIVMNSAELEAHRIARRDNRGRVIGGGFGAEGAIRGAVGAWEANVALGALHGIANTMGRAASNVSDRRKKEALFADPSTRSGLAEAVHQLVFDVHFAIVDAIHEHRADERYQPVAEADAAKASALIENVERGRIPSEAVADRVLDALRLDPYGDRAYAVWLERFGDRSAQLSKIASHFGVDSVDASKKRLLDNRRRSLSFSTIEECAESLHALAAYAATLGITNIERYRTEITTTANRLDIERRTFGGKLYDTFGEAQAAKAAREKELRRTVDGQLYQNDEDAEAARARNIETESAQRRTVAGVIYTTEQEAATTRTPDYADPFGILFAIMAAVLWIRASMDASALTYILPATIAVIGASVAQNSRRSRGLYFNVTLISLSLVGVCVCVFEATYRFDPPGSAELRSTSSSRVVTPKDQHQNIIVPTVSVPHFGNAVSINSSSDADEDVTGMPSLNPGNSADGKISEESSVKTEDPTRRNGITPKPQDGGATSTARTSQWIGNYVGDFEGDTPGSVTISKAGGGKLSVHIAMQKADCGGDYQAVIGDYSDTRMSNTSKPNDFGDRCTITLAKQDSGMAVRESGPCTKYRGPACSFDGIMHKR